MLVFQNIFIQKFNHFENIDFTLFDIYIACKLRAQFNNKRQSTKGIMIFEAKIEKSTFIFSYLFYR